MFIRDFLGFLVLVRAWVLLDHHRHKHKHKNILLTLIQLLTHQLEQQQQQHMYSLDSHRLPCSLHSVPTAPGREHDERMHHPRRERERRQWVPPGSVGRTLCQCGEAKEQELGLRCDDVICLFGPTDEDPVPSETQSETETETRRVMEELKMRRVQLRGAYETRGRMCEHEFHPACLVASTRVAGMDDDDTEKEEEEESEVVLTCPICRADGAVCHKGWLEGVRSLRETV